MPRAPAVLAAPHARFELPKYDEIALVLQGGGALGSYQAGVYEGLSERGVEPTWIAGISIGALNAAILAGNAPEDRVEALKGFWKTITKPDDAVGLGGAWILQAMGFDAAARGWASGWSAMRAVLEGQDEFFSLRLPVPFAGFDIATPDKVSYYDTAPLIDTLKRYADFDRINDGGIRVSVGAVNIRRGNFVYFDNSKMRLKPEHFAASSALPPGFPAVEIEGEYYWDGGVVSNTPLIEIFSNAREKNILAFQLDLWSAKGKLPGTFAEIEERLKDIQYSSRTRTIEKIMTENRHRANAIKEFLDHLPEEIKNDNPHIERACKIATSGTINLIHLTYQNRLFEKHYKDVEFSRDTMLEHWASGLEDIRQSFEHRDWFFMPSHELGFVTHDIHRTSQRPIGSSAPEDCDRDTHGEACLTMFRQSARPVPD